MGRRRGAGPGWGVAALALAAALVQGLPAAAARPSSHAAVQLLADDLCPRDGEGLIVCGRRALPPEAARSLRLVGQCLARWKAGAAGALVARPYDPAQAPRALAAMIAASPRCAPPRRMKVSGVLLAGAVAEALLLREGLGADPAGAARPIAARDETEAMGLCLVRTRGAEVDRLLAARPGSRGEAEAVASLTPLLPGCLRTGLRLVATPEALRALLALSAWRSRQTGREEVE